MERDLEHAFGNIAMAFRGKELKPLKGKLGKNDVPTFGPDLVMDDTH
jgi:hypothetical protein